MFSWYFRVGPTVHVELALRNRANLMFMSDYAEKNNSTVVNWITGKYTDMFPPLKIYSRPDYDWDWMCDILNNCEKTTETPEEMQRRAREKIQAVLEAKIRRQKKSLVPFRLMYFNSR